MEASHSSAIQRTMGAFEWILLIILSVLWGGSFFFVSVAVRDMAPLSIVAGRLGLAAVVLHGVIAVRGLRLPRDLRTWGFFLFMGLLNNVVPFSLFVWAQTRIAGGLASILNATTPLFTVLVAHLLTADEKLDRGRMAGILLGFTGVVAMIGPDALRHFGSDVTAQIVTLGAPLSYAFGSVLARRFGRMGIVPMAAATGQVTGAALILVPVALIIDQPWRAWAVAPPGLASLASVAGLALLSTTVAYAIYFRILARAGASNVSLVTFLIPVSAILLGAAFLHERLQAVHFLGLGLIGLGLAAIDGRPLGFMRRFVRRISRPAPRGAGPSGGA